MLVTRTLSADVDLLACCIAPIRGAIRCCCNPWPTAPRMRAGTLSLLAASGESNRMTNGIVRRWRRS